MTVLPGSTARIKWTFKGDPSRAVLGWYFTKRGGREEEIAIKFYTGDPTISNSSLPGVAIEPPATLVLKNVDKRYNGKYRFHASVANGGGISKVVIIVAEKPTVTFGCPSLNKVNEGGNFTCVCIGIGGNPPANVTWFKDDVQIGGPGKEKQTLTFRNIGRTASGKYKCEAQSHTLTDEKSIEIIVYC